MIRVGITIHVQKKFLGFVVSLKSVSTNWRCSLKQEWNCRWHCWLQVPEWRTGKSSLAMEMAEQTNLKPLVTTGAQARHSHERCPHRYENADPKEQRLPGDIVESSSNKLQLVWKCNSLPQKIELFIQHFLRLSGIKKSSGPCLLPQPALVFSSALVSAPGRLKSCPLPGCPIFSSFSSRLLPLAQSPGLLFLRWASNYPFIQF